MKIPKPPIRQWYLFGTAVRKMKRNKDKKKNKKEE